ncbi:uncharacterized protein FOMMEDRAFT_21309 [Fomitiporia mediterranea MF3/22]|uniref:uncharacterized protein n=1 Tax=Fomitiporia mediterranea (strain MF3/22) TaxID=694068 RepID=UPI00044086AD|nr:uncharacterized protein FOMMEDRAFT_21309 [Fomitiporia mediterranea MF3/22]EJD00803.1 hypothetical protein FOMMEDRAFT_21309 [Fomitiporia mediterranea MF3/22]
MHPTLRASAHVHRPLIHFIGKRQWPAKPEPPHAHPAGPPEYKAHFADFLKKFESSASSSRSVSSSSSNSVQKGKDQSDAHSDAYQEFWQAPQRLWNPRVRNISEKEMDAVLSGGATLF